MLHIPIKNKLLKVFTGIPTTIIVAHIFSGVVDMDPPLSPGGRRTYDLCGTCKSTMDNEVPRIMY